MPKPPEPDKKCITYYDLLRENAELQAELEQAHAEAAVMREALETASGYARHKPDCIASADDSDVCSCGWLIDRLVVNGALSNDLAVQARHLLDVVAGAREFHVAYNNWLGRPLRYALGGLPDELVLALSEKHANLIGVLAVYDDKGTKEKANGEG